MKVQQHSSNINEKVQCKFGLIQKLQEGSRLSEKVKSWSNMTWATLGIQRVLVRSSALHRLKDAKGYSRRSMELTINIRPVIGDQNL